MSRPDIEVMRRVYQTPGRAFTIDAETLQQVVKDAGALLDYVAELEALVAGAYRDGERAIERVGKLEHDLRCLQESTVDRKAWEQQREKIAALEASEARFDEHD